MISINIFAILFFLVQGTLSQSVTMQINSHNIDEILKLNDVVFINFYAEWCQYSKMLGSVYEDMAAEILAEYHTAKVVFGKVDAEKEADLAFRYKIKKYPTLKMFRVGEPVKREYRGQRSVKSLVDFVRHQLEDPVTELTDENQLKNLDGRYFIGYFQDHQTSEYLNYHRVSCMLRDDCLFYASFGQSSEQTNEILFHAPEDKYRYSTYTGRIDDYVELVEWMTEICVPFVREITFQNAEELTEEGLPLMILFHHPNDVETPSLYRQYVFAELSSNRYSINFLTANGLKFSHPLRHLGRTVQQLPVLAIDSFKHMFLWKYNPKTDLGKSGLLKQFVADFHSGQLHRDFHRDQRSTNWLSADINISTPGPASVPFQSQPRHILKDIDHSESSESAQTFYSTNSLLDSIFVKLAPSKARYTLVRDEL